MENLMKILLTAIMFLILSFPPNYALAGICLPANSPGTQTIVDIRIDGKTVKEAPGFKIIPPKQEKSQTLALKKDCALPIGTVIQIPHRTIIMMKSLNDNEITLYPGSRMRIHNISNTGEAYG